MKASAPGTILDDLEVNAYGDGFRLGGETASYCPTSVGDLCPPGNATVFTFGTISVLVPGGQRQYFLPSGKIDYTQAHSLDIPPDAQQGGFGYEKCPDDEFGRVTVSAFGADGLMGCPRDDSYDPVYMVYAKVENPEVPTGNVDDCIDFVGLTTDFTGRVPNAWQY